MKNRNPVIDKRYVQLARMGGLLDVVVVLPDDKLLRVKSSAPNVFNMKEGDLLKKCSDGYELIRKKGRPSVGEVLLPSLTVPKALADDIKTEARGLKISRAVLRRTIIEWYFIKGGKK